MKNAKLNAAKRGNDEFYTRLCDIESEMAAYLDFDPRVFSGKSLLLPCDDPEKSAFSIYFRKNFAKFGLKELVVSGCAKNAFRKNGNGEEFFRLESGSFDGSEVSSFRDSADIVITNPPFSRLRDFIGWLGGKKFIIIASKSCATYSNVFPLIKSGEIQMGARPWSGGMWFETPEGGIFNIPAIWLSSLPHTRLFRKPVLKTMSENLANPRLVLKNVYVRYDNYDAIEVPETAAIPSDYSGVMGVPISFLDKYDPEQFEILGATESEGKGFSEGLWKGGAAHATIGGRKIYKRLFIRKA